MMTDKGQLSALRKVQTLILVLGMSVIKVGGQSRIRYLHESFHHSDLQLTLVMSISLRKVLASIFRHLAIQLKGVVIAVFTDREQRI